VGLDVILQVGLGKLILAADIQCRGQMRFLVESLVERGARQQFKKD